MTADLNLDVHHSFNAPLRALRPPIDGHRLRGDTLAELVDDTTLLVFLRHYG